MAIRANNKLQLFYFAFYGGGDFSLQYQVECQVQCRFFSSKPPSISPPPRTHLSPQKLKSSQKTRRSTSKRVKSVGMVPESTNSPNVASFVGLNNL